MGTDQFLIIVSQFCMYVMPILGVVLLVFLIMCFKHLLVVLKSLDTALVETTKTIQDCDAQVKKLDKPLHTVNELSETVDYVHDSTKKALTSTISIVLNNIGNISDWVKEKKQKEENTCSNESEVVNHE